MAVTFFSGEEAKGSTAFENPERYQRVEYSHPNPNKASNTEEIKRTLTKKLTARKTDDRSRHSPMARRFMHEFQGAIVMRVLDFIGSLIVAGVLGVGTYQCIKFLLSKSTKSVDTKEGEHDA